MSKGIVLFSVLTILIVLTWCATRSNGQQKLQNKSCVTSSCGGITISYPFSLKGDHPLNCRYPDPIFMLECKENQVILSSDSRSYNVQKISYSDYSIRIADPGIDSQDYSSCPIYSSLDDGISSTNMFRDYKNNVRITFLNCLSPVPNPLFLENPFCGNRSVFSNSTRIFSYFTVDSILVSDLEESCAFDTMIETSSPTPLNGTSSNYSYSMIHDLMAYGFELTWYRAMCGECEKSKGTCSLEENKIVCGHYCYEHTPLADRNFLCKLEFYAPYLFIACLAIGGIIGLRFVCGIPFLIGLVAYKMRRRRLSMDERETIEELSQLRMINHFPVKYTYAEVKKMTKNFKCRLSESADIGTAFRGNLKSGPSVVIKMLTNPSVSNKEFINQLSKVARTKHPNVMKLLGFCIDRSNRAIIQEFMPDGSLHNHMYSKGMSTIPLEYTEMFKISLGIARGIEHLHSTNIFSLNLKPQNILLDEYFNPKISDYGMAKLQPTETRKRGFVAPEIFYKNLGEITPKADVYSFGMLVLEMAERRLKSLNQYGENACQFYFPSWIYNEMNGKKEVAMIGADEEERKMVKKMVIAGLWCIQIKPVDRPSMNEIVEMLQGKFELLQLPPMPFQIESSF